MLSVLPAFWQRASSRRRRVRPDRRLPIHVGIVMDGNRRWARAGRHLDVSVGHRHGAEHLEDFLGWCADRGIEHVSAYVLSADNIRRRERDEVDYLFELLRGRARPWRRPRLPPQIGRGT